VYYSHHPGVLDIRGRSDFSRFDPRPERPHFSNFGPPAERRPLFVERRDLFVRDAACGRTLADLTLPRPETRPHFSNFGPPAAPTLATTLLAAWTKDLFAEAPVSVRGGGRAAL